MRSGNFHTPKTIPVGSLFVRRDGYCYLEDKFDRPLEPDRVCLCLDWDCKRGLFGSRRIMSYMSQGRLGTFNFLLKSEGVLLRLPG